MLRARRFSQVAISAVAVVVALIIAGGGALAHDEAKYPDWKGRWVRNQSGNFDPGKPAGLKQQAPFTPEYQKVLEASVADQAAGGQGNNPMAACVPPGMPRMMIGYGGGMEIVITSDLTVMLMGEPMRQLRRIHTDGGGWPAVMDQSFSGTSIGAWEDTDGDGRYDTLQVETRGMRGPRSYDSSGAPFHQDGQAVVKERIYLDKSNPDRLVDDVTVIDHALTGPWTVRRTYARERNPAWLETICGEDEHQVRIGKEDYFTSGDGLLMPTRKDQPPPGLRDFSRQP
jgi:hypothetical protein